MITSHKSIISFVCCYNDLEKLGRLRFSIEKLDGYEFIAIDNTTNRFCSAASALNYGYSITIGDIIIFLHQDIIINEISDIDLIREFVLNNQNTIVGAAGVKNKHNTEILSSIFDPTYPNGYKRLNALERVFTIDECFMAIHRKTFEILGMFDDRHFDGWHLYVADLCIAGRRYGAKTFVFPINLYHLSSGTIDSVWWEYMKILLKKYERSHILISTTCGQAFTIDSLNKAIGFLGKKKRLIKRIIEKYCNMFRHST